MKSVCVACHVAADLSQFVHYATSGSEGLESLETACSGNWEGPWRGMDRPDHSQARASTSARGVHARGSRFWP